MSNTVNNYTETDLGNISLNPRGEYDNSAAYEYLDTVSYQGGSYFCLAELETTITGIAPDAGHNSEHWQMIAAPGDMTPEYTAAYNDVINKAVQVEISRAAVELAQQEIETSQANVQELHSDTVQVAQEAENSKNSAANSAQSAEQSRKTVSESEQNINGQIAGFDSRVSEAVEQSKEEINTTKQQAINTITNQQTTSVNTVKTEGEKIITRVGDDAKTVADDRVTVEEATQTVLNNAQEVARNAQTVASNTENAAASAESAKTSADNAAQSAKSVEDASKQIEQNKKDVDSLKEDLLSKITKFYASNQGETHITDSDNGKIQDMMIYGKLSQDGTPSPENPVEIKSVVNPTVKVTNEDGLKVQSVTLNNITLNAIPTSSDGNVTIGEQQYISDYVDVEKEKLYRKVKRLNLKDVDDTRISFGFHSNENGYLSISTIENINKEQQPISNQYKSSAWTDKSGYVYIPSYNSIVFVDDRFTDRQTAIKLVQDTYVIYVLSSQTEEDLSLEQIKSLKSLSTYYPTTNISVNSEQLDGYTVFNYPTPFEDEWNKTQKEIGGLKEDLTSKADKTSLAQTDRKLDALWKLNQGISYEFQTDDTEAYQKTVPSGAKMVSIKSIGGKLTSDDAGEQMSAPVNEVIEQGKNYFDFSRLVSDGVNVMDYDNQTITVPARTNNTGYNQTLRDLCPGITPGTYVLSMKRSNPESGNGSYFLEAAKDFSINTPIELTDELLDNHIAWYNNPDSNIENVISEIQIEKNSAQTLYSQYYQKSHKIPQAILELDGYGESGNFVDFVEKKYHKGDRTIDISDIIGDTFKEPFEAEAGGTLTFKNSHGDDYRIPVSSSEEYLVSLAEVEK